MPNLKCSTVTTIQVDSNDLDRFISEVYRRPYESVCENQWSNDSVHDIHVKKQSLDRYDAEALRGFIGNHRKGCNLRALLQDCANKGLIEPGHYLISVCW